MTTRMGASLSNNGVGGEGALAIKAELAQPAASAAIHLFIYPLLQR
jgi:hypothetical protein